MPTKIILSNLDLDLNQLLKAKLENLATDPANSESRLYYNTTIKKVKYFNGTVWLTVVDDLDTRLTNSRTTSHVIATNLALGAEHTISGAAAGWFLELLEHLQLTPTITTLGSWSSWSKYALANRRSHRRSCSTQINK
jgi:hypothetical protein